jgi:hypothetical protein
MRCITGDTPIAPLVALRIGIGVILALSTLRVFAKGWIDALYVQPAFHFTYFGFGWVKPLGLVGMHMVFAALFVCAVLVAVGLFYRVAIVLFFLLFTYVELIDVATYLNHYYFVSLLALLLCFVPAHRAFSLDVRWRSAAPAAEVPLLWLRAVQLQVALVYGFAGIAKINADWLLEAQPLRIWLHVESDLPLIGALLQQEWIAYAASWAAMLFDTTIAFFMFWHRTRVGAYIVALIFHLLTAVLFPGIGLFPFIMATAALVFLPHTVHARLLRWIGRRSMQNDEAHALSFTLSPRYCDEGSGHPLTLTLSRSFTLFLILWFTFQFLIPLRHLCYPGQLFYHEQGYRFSWRVMLMEKAGTVFFTLKDPVTGKVVQVKNRTYLTDLQEKQMSTQPDLILQFAQHLRDRNHDRIADAEVYAEAYVTVNGRGSRLFIDPSVDLARVNEGFADKIWVYDE